MQKIAIINRGIPASGKSEFAKRIVDRVQKSGLRAISCSTDDYFMVDGVYSFDASKLREYHLKNQERFRDSLNQGVDLVICDNTNLEPWEAKPYYMMAKEKGYRVILMDFLPRDIKEHFAIQKNHQGYNHNIPLDVLENMEKSYLNYKKLTKRDSYPTSNQPKRDYNQVSKRVEVYDEPSEPFYYDELIQISPNEYFKIRDIIGDMILKKMRNYQFDEIKLIPRHYKIIMEAFEKNPDKTLTPYDLKDILSKSPKQIERYIEDLQNEFHNIIEIKIGRKKAYKLIDSFDIFIEASKQDEALNDLLNLAQQMNPKLFEKLEYITIKENTPYFFKNSIFESITNIDIFEELKRAVNRHEYRRIKFFDKDITYEVKCIKIVFIDNNWYLAYVDSDDILKLGRISFIEKVEYATKNSYQKSSIKKHLKSLKSKIQNSMTLFDAEFKRATLQATPNIARYFKKDMKKFFPTQKFKEELDDGSIIFTIDYTQELEILPFIQKWMPSLIIKEPKELREHYINKLKEAIKNHTK